MNNCAIFRSICRRTTHFATASALNYNFAMEGEKVGPEIIEDNNVWREVTIPVPWGTVTGKWWGTRSKQPILALHGWQDNCGTWDRLMPLMPSDIPVFCIDQPGHGFSSHYPRGQIYYVFWDSPMLIRRIVQYYKWQKITILGHSMGGIGGFMYAALFPDDVDRLISIDIAGPTVKPADEISAFSADIIEKFLKYENMKEEVPSYEYEEMIDVVEEAYHGMLTRESCKILMRRGMTPSKKNNNTFIFSRDPRLKVGGLGLIPMDVSLHMATLLKCRHLNIKGDPGIFADKKFNGNEYYHTIIDKLRENIEVEFHEIPGTHHLHLNTPEAILSVIVNFLRRTS